MSTQSTQIDLTLDDAARAAGLSLPLVRALAEGTLPADLARLLTERLRANLYRTDAWQRARAAQQRKQERRRGHRRRRA